MGYNARALSRRNKPPRKAASIQLLPIFGLPEISRRRSIWRDAIVDAARQSQVPHSNKATSWLSRRKSCPRPKASRALVDDSRRRRPLDLAARLKKDARLVEVILRESRRIVRSEPVLIVETHHGFVCANAGVDQSNVPGVDIGSLLPRDPGPLGPNTCGVLRKRRDKRVAVIISDTFGRPWRLGLTNVAIGAAGLPVLLDLRGSRDLHGKPLHATILAVADELAAAAGLAMGKSAGVPAVVVRGYHYRPAREIRGCSNHPSRDRRPLPLECCAMG